MPVVDVADDTFVRAGRDRVLGASGPLWAQWLPGLRLVVTHDRGLKGVRWQAASAPGHGRWTGTAEVWLEEVPAGTVVHLYVRLDPAPGVRAGRGGGRLPDRLRRTWKRGLHRSKDVMEGEWSR